MFLIPNLRRRRDLDPSRHKHRRGIAEPERRQPQDIGHGCIVDLVPSNLAVDGELALEIGGRQTP